MNPIIEVGKSKEFKDRLAGWKKWKIQIPQCKECGRKNTFYTLSGTRADAERWAANADNNYCDKCS